MKKIILLFATCFSLYSSHAQFTPPTGGGNIYYNSGNVGIGTTNPHTLLDLGDLRFGLVSAMPEEGLIGEGTWGNYILGDVNSLQRLRIGVSNDGYTRAEIFIDNSNRQDGTLSFKTANMAGGVQTRMFINGNGNVGIGTINVNGTDYKLYVETGIRTRRIVVDHAAWPDYVFNPGYRLMPLDSVAQYTKRNGHLPDMPTAEEVAKNGIDLGNNQAALLKKIEELTLYNIELEKKVKKLGLMAAQMDAIQKKVDLLVKQTGAR